MVPWSPTNPRPKPHPDQSSRSAELMARPTHRHIQTAEQW